MDESATYWIAMPSFLAEGGARYRSIPGNTITREIGDIDNIIFEEYLRDNDPITQETEDRITLNYYPGKYVNNTTDNSATMKSSAVFLLILTMLFNIF